MTKPKTVKQLLAEANKLARERGCEIKAVSEMAWGSRYWHATSTGGWDLPDVNIRWAHTKSQAYRCLIAALREVPVVKRGKK